MGDRANIVLRQQDQAIYLYSHWGGYDMPETLRQALVNGRNRWNDETYLGRIIFNTMTKGYEDGEAGFGIGVYPSDNEYAYLVVDARAGMVTVHRNLPRQEDGSWTRPFREFTFEEYVAEPRTWDNVQAPAPQEVAT
jgi:hypothetical protein